MSFKIWLKNDNAFGLEINNQSTNGAAKALEQFSKSAIIYKYLCIFRLCESRVPSMRKINYTRMILRVNLLFFSDLQKDLQS